jgi:hypothetical protein
MNHILLDIHQQGSMLPQVPPSSLSLRTLPLPLFTPTNTRCVAAYHQQSHPAPQSTSHKQTNRSPPKITHTHPSAVELDVANRLSVHMVLHKQRCPLPQIPQSNKTSTCTSSQLQTPRVKAQGCQPRSCCSCCCCCINHCYCFATPQIPTL